MKDKSSKVGALSMELYRSRVVYAVLAIAVLFAAPSLAIGQDSTGSFTPGCNPKGCTAKIGGFILWGSGQTDIVLKGVSDLTDAIEGCVPSDGNRFQLNPASQTYDQAYAALLAADHADQSVFLRIVQDASTNHCKISYVRVPYPPN